MVSGRSLAYDAEKKKVNDDEGYILFPNGINRLSR